MYLGKINYLLYRSSSSTTENKYNGFVNIDLSPPKIKN
jgi:hypothetical protein